MQDHIFESYEEEQERETVDSLAEHELFAHARGDDRTEFSPYETLAPFDHETVTTSRPRSSAGPAPETKGSDGAGPSGPNQATTEEQAA